ncbi:hypothetical protein IF1G_02836 [Cordyceps javanica]|uniref:Uncharacterized protein n=1 Tax=Cordyceps javanica TaxID=43265 RepID=A0A545VAJ8_9HYPO|nr:hypothetical protein IF1G_02836 [Cordyceps javanica]
MLSSLAQSSAPRRKRHWGVAGSDAPAWYCRVTRTPYRPTEEINICMAIPHR